MVCVDVLKNFGGRFVEIEICLSSSRGGAVGSVSLPLLMGVIEAFCLRLCSNTRGLA